MSGSWHDELELITEMSTVNKRVSAYVLRALDADACRDEPTAPADENALGQRLIDLGRALQSRATHRSANTRCISGERSAGDGTAQNSPHKIQTPWSNPATSIYTP